MTTQVVVESAVGTPHRDASRRGSIVRLARYSATSVVAFAVSEFTLLALYGWNVTGATAAAVLASLAGTVPSYLMSRYWIWSEAPRARVGRQVAMYWTTSILCIAGTSLATGAIAGLAPSGQRFHLVVAGTGFLVVNIVFWLVKFEVYQKIIFPVYPRGAQTPDGSSERAPDGMAVEPVS